ncbi:E3 ubiquitin-protein ligase [Diplodia seriata]|uniref:E3 ubiquitin-protein ligase n=1 Tax=Diplodia seriata TaxID=420778 RepID=A0A1S8B5P6_9PEZI|nr:E3 ubiquitin-protein ligase [Diplodia seriata]
MEQQPEFPLARVLLAIIPAALVFLFFVSVLLWVPSRLLPQPPSSSRCRCLVCPCIRPRTSCGLREMSWWCWTTTRQPWPTAPGWRSSGGRRRLRRTFSRTRYGGLPPVSYEAVWSVADVFDVLASAICLDAVERRDSVRDLPCSHVFHTGCLDGWVSRGHYYCPLCHRPVLLQLGDEYDDAHGEV